MIRVTLGVAALLSVGALATTPARAVTSTYTFSGPCTDCSAQAGTTITATASLVLNNYTLGQDIDDTNFVSFTYNGTNLLPAYTVTAAAPNLSFSGSINAPLPSAETVGIFSDSREFVSDASGTWCTGARFSCSLDVGSTHLWSADAASAVPEPVTASLLGAGLFGLAVARRRRGV